MVNVANAQNKLGETDWEIPDPGDEGAIPNWKSGVCALTTAAAETRTLADPTAAGLMLTLTSLSISAGDCVITTASGVNVSGHTTITGDAAGEIITLISVPLAAGGYVWRALACVPEAETMTPS